MTTYTIFANGIDMGDFKGFNDIEAVNEYIRSIGYENAAVAADELGMHYGEFLDQITVERHD